MASNTKPCTKCKVEKDKTEFHKNRSRYDGLQTYCKECYRNYREENRDVLKIKHRAYYAANRDERLARAKAYYAANRDKIKAQNAVKAALKAGTLVKPEAC